MINQRKEDNRLKKMKTIRCPYCGANAKLRPATVVYGDAALNKTVMFTYATVIRYAMLM